MVGAVWGLGFAPEDAKQGNSYRIIYIHVPAAVIAPTPAPSPAQPEPPVATQPTAPLAVALLFVTLLKLACELAVLKHADTDSDRWTQLRRTAALQTGALRPVLAVRLLTALAGGVFLPFVIATGAGSVALGISAFVLCLLGELAERYLFFTSVAPDKMPV